ncbi:hypothetical protein C1645_812646 [Glomus cerebriforme]|uniref:Uncharacterized protein n=1 Tax=Glomus cerebriforme TaxID=658196 RepID=A0A397TKY8_9GLOM|nr:hypothetical protein C1645_812646 [Glomus cerebriforme]
MVPFANNERANQTTQPSSYTPQYTGDQHQSISLPVESLNMIANNSYQTNPFEIFRFEIPGFKIIIIPTISSYVNLNNLDMQNQLQPDHHLTTNIFTDNSQTQFQHFQQKLNDYLSILIIFTTLGVLGQNFE